MFYLIEIDLSIELLFLLNISGAESANKNESLAVQLKTQNRSRQLWFLSFPDFFKCHVKELIGAILWLSKSNQQENENFSKNLNRVNPMRASILVKLQDLN